MTIHSHLFRAAPELGAHVCADCPLAESHAVHDVPTIEGIPERYEVETEEAS